VLQVRIDLGVNAGRKHYYTTTVLSPASSPTLLHTHSTVRPRRVIPSSAFFCAISSLLNGKNKSSSKRILNLIQWWTQITLNAEDRRHREANGSEANPRVAQALNLTLLLLLVHLPPLPSP
jgi:hypothetical protein